MKTSIAFFNSLPIDNTPILPRVFKKKKVKPPKLHRAKTERKKELVKKKKHKPNPSNYHSYIVSPAWYRRRSTYFKVYKEMCVICSDTNRVTLHHKHYGTISRERDKDLVALCWECHGKYHRLHKVTSTKTTHQFIDSERFVLRQQTT